MSKEIVDKESIYKVLNLLFGKLPVYILDNGREYPIKVVALKPNGLVISHGRNITSPERILTLTHNGMQFKTFLKFLGGDKNGIEVLQPIKIEIEEARRTSNRVVMEGDVNSPKVTHIVNQHEIHKAQGFNDANVDKIIQKYLQSLRKVFDYANIYYSSRMDNRLRLMQNYDKPIFIPNRNYSDTVPRDYFPYEEYYRILQVSKLDDRYISEICVPIKYKGYTPLGYVQVLGFNPLNQESFETVKKVAEAISRDIIHTGIFQESREICEVGDLSSTGLSFLHPQSRFFSRTFSMGETILFELIFPNQARANIRAVIKNIKNMETNFRVGVEFYNLTLHDYNMVEEYLGKNSTMQST